MRIKKRFLWIIFFSGIIICIYRNEALNWLQVSLLKSISSKALISNGALLKDSTVSQHLVYTLKGTERIWPHRVNSLRRLDYLYSEFAGFECDIQFDADSARLYVAHDDPASLQFKDYLLADKDHKLFWLDVKNLNRNNVRAFCDELQQLDRQFDIKQRVIIESYDTAIAERIGELGYLNCFNPLAIMVAAPARQKEYIAAVKKLLPRKIKLLSAAFETRDFLSKNFPGRKQLTWDIVFWDALSREKLLKIANDTTELVCLINIKSPGYR
jgi:hypothetical protein